MIVLGQECKDKVTGFKGIAIGHCKYMTGCDQYGLSPKVSKDGKIEPVQWFDEARLTVIGKGILASKVTGEIPGGPTNRDAPR